MGAMLTQAVIVGFSGGVSSAWCAGWALRTFPREHVVFLHHDTKEEDPDTYRFIREMAAALEHPITERSDGRSVTEVFYDEGALANNRMAFCSRILKAEQKERYVRELRAVLSVAAGLSGAPPAQIVNVLGFSAIEWKRISRATGWAEGSGVQVRFPMAELGVTKQAAVDWCRSLGVRPPRMYAWSEHANCVGCARGGKAYWLEVARNAPEVFAQRVELEREFAHTFLKDTTLEQLVQVGLKRKVVQREAIEIGTCECGD